MIVQVDANDIVFGSNVVSIAEDEFIHDRSYCTQPLWMNQMFENFGIFQDMLMIYCDNTIVIHIF